MDRNIITAVRLAQGKFLWLIGDDDYVCGNGAKQFLSFLEGLDQKVKVVVVAASPETPNKQISNADLVLRPNAFLSSTVFVNESVQALDPKDVEKGIDTGYAHSWFIRLLGLADPLAEGQFYSQVIVSGEQSNKRVVLLEQLKFNRSFLIQYWNLLSLALSRGQATWHFLPRFILKLLSSLFFPFFHLLCERVFRPKSKESIAFKDLWAILPLLCPFLYLWRGLLWLLPHALNVLMLKVTLVLLRFLRLTPETSYEFWESYWSKNSSDATFNNRSYF
jgi:hypothetical protein